ncbi:hypothetical protein [Actinomycetospora aeridis]|uniref:Uncharacterized protein n=1 Tax=Actinomycetospora aeridis TaxID=3129231 RepID=A0ABU8N848_9PSEU
MAVQAAVGALGVGVGAWLVTPLVSMARRGTRDEQTVEAWRGEADRAAAVRRAHRREAIVASIPTQRTADQATQPRRSPIAS